MRKVYYMDFQVGATDLDKVGGLPTHLPEKFPVSKTSGNQLGFLMQLYCDGERLAIPDTLCLQIYQSVEIDVGDDPTPVVVKVTTNATVNEGLGVTHSDIEEHKIIWTIDEEPDVLPFSLDMNPESLKMLKSKLQGAIPAEFIDRNNLIFLGWVADYPLGFNFTGLLALLMDSENNVFCEML